MKFQLHSAHAWLVGAALTFVLLARAFRSIVLTLLFKIANREPVTADVMKGVIAQADGESLRRVHERLAPPTGARRPIGTNPAAATSPAQPAPADPVWV